MDPRTWGPNAHLATHPIGTKRDACELTCDENVPGVGFFRFVLSLMSPRIQLSCRDCLQICPEDGSVKSSAVGYIHFGIQPAKSTTQVFDKDS
jgi:hypothetical protein